jgi:hypothetical protein
MHLCTSPISRGVGDGWPTAARPLFVDAASGYLHLGAKSPCIDGGNNDAPANTGIVAGDRYGTTTFDMGVDEVLHPAFFRLSCVDSKT